MPFPFLIGKVLTIARGNGADGDAGRFPFLIGKVLTSDKPVIVGIATRRFHSL